MTMETILGLALVAVTAITGGGLYISAAINKRLKEKLSYYRSKEYQTLAFERELLNRHVGGAQ